jgi:hypothetical protein
MWRRVGRSRKSLPAYFPCCHTACRVIGRPQYVTNRCVTPLSAASSASLDRAGRPSDTESFVRGCASGDGSPGLAPSTVSAKLATTPPTTSSGADPDKASLRLQCYTPHCMPPWSLLSCVAATLFCVQGQTSSPPRVEPRARVRVRYRASARIACDRRGRGP